MGKESCGCAERQEKLNEVGERLGPGGRRKYPPEYPERLTARCQETQKPRQTPRFLKLPR